MNIQNLNYENITSDNGWLKIKPQQYQRLYSECDLLKLTDCVHSIRPKSLSGIETNNNWISIHSEDDLPKESDFYCIKTESGDELIGYNALHKRLFASVDNQEINYRFITHWQPILKPKSPIY